MNVSWTCRRSMLTWFALGIGVLAAPQSVWAASEKVVYAFKAHGPANPGAGLISVGGALYGTTDGFQSLASIFKLTPSGKVHTLASFAQNFGGVSALLAVGKVFYGVTDDGGDPTCRCGFVFSATQAGAVTVLHNFTGGSDGAGPSGSLIDLGGVLYGTTADGGTGNCSGYYNGCGTVFSITPQGDYKQIYAFQGASVGDGSFPGGPLTAVDGVLYGTTGGGGTAKSQVYAGTFFSLTVQGVETVLHSFGTTKKDGSIPGSGLLAVGDILYGTAASGGAGQGGVAYSIKLDGSHETILHSFGSGGADGTFPNGGLILVNGVLYGTTSDGGSSGNGTVFSLTETGDEAVVYSFKGINKQLGTADAINPNSPLLYIDGSFYGTSLAGGRMSNRYCYLGSCGTVFEVTP